MRHRISGASWPEATKGSHNRWWPPWLAREPGNLCAILQMGKPQWWRMGPWIQINLIFLKIKERNISCDTWFERMRSTCFQIPRKKTREGCLQQLAHSGYSWGEERDCLRRKAGTSTFILTPLYCLNFWHWIPITFVCFFFFNTMKELSSSAWSCITLPHHDHAAWSCRASCLPLPPAPGVLCSLSQPLLLIHLSPSLVTHLTGAPTHADPAAEPTCPSWVSGHLSLATLCVCSCHDSVTCTRFHHQASFQPPIGNIKSLQYRKLHALFFELFFFF